MRFGAPARLAVFLWLIAMLGGLAIVYESRFATDMSFFLPTHPSAAQQTLIDQIKGGVGSRLLMIGIGGGDAAQCAQMSRELTVRLANRPELVFVRNGARQDMDADRDFLFRHRYQLSAAVTPERFTVSGLRSAITESIDLLASPAGVLLKPWLVNDPTGELVGLLSSLATGSPPNSLEGAWASRDGARAVLLAQTRALGSDTDGQAAAIQAIHDEFATISRALGGRATKLQIAGPGVFAVSARAKIQSEVTRLSTISSLAIIGLLCFVYRSFRLVGLGLLPVVSGVLAGIVAVSLLCDRVFGITVGFGSALIGEAVDYSIYYFVQSSGSDANHWRTRFWPTIRLGVATSVCGFGVLPFAGFPGLAQLGIYSLSGLLAAATVTRFVLPTLVPIGSTVRDLRGIGQSCAQLIVRAQRLRVPCLVVGLLAMAVLYGHRGHLWAEGLATLSTANAQDVDADATLRADLGAPDAGLLLVVSAAGREQALQAAESVGAKLDHLVAAGVIGGYDTPVRFLPSEEMQRMRRASLPAPDELRERLPLAVADLPLSADKLAPFLADVENARSAPLISPAALAGTGWAVVVDSLLLPHDAGWSVLLPIHRASDGMSRGIDSDYLRKELTGSGIMFIEMKTELDGLYTQYLDEALTLSMAGFIAIVGILAVTLRSLHRLTRVLAPLLLAVLIVAAGLALSDVRLQLLHLIGMLLIVAIGSNYALFFDEIGERLYREAQTLASIWLACLSTAIGFGTLALADVPVLQALGVTVAPGAVLALLLTASFAVRPTAP